MQKVLMICFLLLLSVCATAAEIGDQLETCAGPDFSTRAEACQLVKRLQELENQLQKKYLKAVKIYQPKALSVEKSMLIASQRAWINYRNKTCDFESQTYGGLYSISRLRCLTRLTELRLDEIYAGAEDE